MTNSPQPTTPANLAPGSAISRPSSTESGMRTSGNEGIGPKNPKGGNRKASAPGVPGGGGRRGSSGAGNGQRCVSASADGGGALARIEGQAGTYVSRPSIVY